MRTRREEDERRPTLVFDGERDLSASLKLFLEYGERGMGNVVGRIHARVRWRDDGHQMASVRVVDLHPPPHNT